MYDAPLRYRGRWFQEHAQISAAPTVLRKSEKTGLTANPPPPALSTARDRKLIHNLTDATPDFVPQPSRTSPALGWSIIAVKPSRRGGSAGWRRSWTSDENTSFFEVMSEVQKDSEDVSAGIGIFFNQVTL